MQQQVLPHVDEYEIISEIGRGGSAVVYEAVDSTKRRVAIKLQKEGATFSQLQRFELEAESLAELDHPHIVRFISKCASSDGSKGLVLEWVGGGTLADEIQRQKVSDRFAIETAMKLASALSIIHEHEMIHRDLKPANVLLTSDGEPKLTDFGIVRDISNDGLTRHGEIHGTLTYMAPEQLKGEEACFSTDVFAFGSILFEMLMGYAPFEDDSADETRKLIRSRDPDRRPKRSRIPRELETIWLKCLNKNPHKRYLNGTELLADLLRYQRGQPLKAKRPTILERSTKFLRRNWMHVLPSFFAGVLVILVVGIIWQRHEATERHNRDVFETRLAKENAKLAQELADSMAYSAYVSQAHRLTLERPLEWTKDIRDTISKANALLVPERDLYDLRDLELRAMADFDVHSMQEVANNVNPFCLAFRPDGKELVVGQSKGILSCSVTRIELDTLRDRKLEFPSSLVIGKTGVRTIAFVDDKLLIAGIRNGELQVSGADGKNGFERYTAHSKEITGMVFCSRYRNLITASEDKTIAIWRLEPDIQQLLSKEITSKISGIALSPDCDMLAVATEHGLMLLNSSTLEPIVNNNLPTRSVSFHPKARIVASAIDSEIRISSFEGNSLTPVITFTDPQLNSTHEKAINRCVFSPDGSMLVSTSGDHVVKIWETATGRLVNRIPVPGTGNVFAEFATYGNHFAVTGDHKTLLYETNESTLAQRFIAQQAHCPRAVAFHPKLPLLLTASERSANDGLRLVELTAWSSINGTPQKSVRFTASPSTVDRKTRALTFDPSGDKVVYSGSFADQICVWQLLDGSTDLVGTTAAYEVMFATAGDAIWGIDDDRVDSLLSFRFPEMAPLSKWTNTGSALATGNSGLTSLYVGATRGIIGSRDGVARQFNPGSEVVREWRTGEPIHCVAQTLDESIVAWGTQDGMLEVASTENGERLFSHRANQHSIESLSFIGDGTLLASGTRDGFVRLFYRSAVGFSKVATLSFPGPIVAVEFGPNNDKLAILVEKERAVRVWDMHKIYERLGAVRLDWRTEHIP